MKINEKFIEDIFNHKIKLKNSSDKIVLSKYIELIPMYDIYTQKIYPIKKENVYFRLTESNYRFINNEVRKWIILQEEKINKKIKDSTNKEEINQMELLKDRLNDMIKIMGNYDIETLIDTSYKILYKYSGIGLSISICKRNSFNPFIYYLKPYYTKNELIKLGQNMNLLEEKIKPEDLIDETKHYEICKKISNNDVSFDEIKEDTLKIIENKTIADICFYSFIGAALINRFLRNQSDFTIDKFFYQRIQNVAKTIKQSTPLEKDYQIYRFISNDDFLQNLKVGDTFLDAAFLSTTRDPFYSPGLTGNFGLILVKINLKKNMKGQGLFIEHFSLFPKEEEFLLPPKTKLKLVSKNDKFKYYHINDSFEKLITKKYEFDLIDNDYKWIEDLKITTEEIPIFSGLEVNFKNRVDAFQKLKSLTNTFNEIKINDIVFRLLFFDSKGSYDKFYYNKVEKGLSLIHFDNNGYPLISIELGNDIVVNFINQYYFYNEKETINEDKLLQIVLELGKIFSYKKAIIYHDYKNFVDFKNNYYKSQEMFLYINHYDFTLYNYLKNKKKPFSKELFYKTNLLDIDLLLNQNNKLKEKLIDSIEKDFNQYHQIVNEYKLNKLNFGVFNIYEKLLSEGKVNVMYDLDYDEVSKPDDILDLIYRQPIRRQS
jgi:hypothetical protein